MRLGIGTTMTRLPGGYGRPETRRVALAFGYTTAVLGGLVHPNTGRKGRLVATRLENRRHEL